MIAISKPVSGRTVSIIKSALTGAWDETALDSIKIS